jgi:hypothetical protein
MNENVLRELNSAQLEKLRKEGFDRTDPSGPWVIVFTLAIVLTLVLVVLAVDYLFQATLDRMEYEKVLSVDSIQLRDLRSGEAAQLNHYKFVDKDKGVVRLPIERAMTLFAAEAAQGKLFYPAKPTKVKTPEEVAAAAGADGQAPPPAGGAGVGN